MSGASPLLPQTRNIFFDEGMAQKNPVEYLRKLANDLGDMYTEIAAKVNQGPEYASQGLQPTPAHGQFLVWKDMTNNKRWLLYNDAGVVKKTELT